MHGLDLNGGSGGSLYANNNGGAGGETSSQSPLHGGDNVNYDPDLPNPPQDNNQMAAWYDTDL